jgi:hypothetical protein
MWNPFEHFDKLPVYNADFSVLFGQPPRATVRLPDGQEIAPATQGHPETLTFWLKGQDGGYDQITQDQSFVQQLWVHFTLDAPSPGGWTASALADLGLAHQYTITPDAMRAAVQAMPHVLDTIQAAGYSEADVWAYAQAEAPWAVGLVGVA